MPSAMYQHNIYPGTELCQLTSLSTKEEGEPDGELFLWTVKQLTQQQPSKQWHRMGEMWLRQTQGPFLTPNCFLIFCVQSSGPELLGTPQRWVCIFVVYVCIHCTVHLCVCVCVFRMLGGIVSEYVGRVLAKCPFLFKERHRAVLNNANNSWSLVLTTGNSVFTKERKL